MIWQNRIFYILRRCDKVGFYMDLQNVPTKLVNKFNKANIRTVEDLQSNYNQLINGLGFGGIFVASLLDYMEREGIKRPEGCSTRREVNCETKREFSFDPPPSKLLTKAFIKANIYSVEDLQKNYKELIKAEYFGNKRVAELIAYMEKLGIKDIPNTLKAKHQASIQSQFEIIKDDVDTLVENKQTKFLFPCNAALSIAFAKLHINNMRDLQKKLPELQETLRSKMVAINELRNWISDTTEYYKNNSSENKQNILTMYQNGLEAILPSKEFNKSQYNQKTAAYLTGKYIADLPRVDGQAMVQLGNVKAQIQKHSFLSENEVLHILSPNTKDISSNERVTAHLLCRAAGFKVRDLRRYGQEKGIDIFVTKNSAVAHLIKELANLAYDFLQSAVIPVDSEQITKAIKKSCTKKFDEGIVSHLLSYLSFIEKNGGKFSIPTHKLKSKSDIAARILYTLDKKLTTEELCTKVNKVLKAKGKPSRTELQRAAVAFAQNALIGFDTRTNEWSFKNR